jgi:hypothetical protein
MANCKLRNIEELEVDKILAELEPLPTGFLDPEPIPKVSPGPASSF